MREKTMKLTKEQADYIRSKKSFKSEGIVKSIRHPTYGFRNDIEWTELFKAIHKDYVGVYYSTPSMDLVVLFEPVTANKMEKE